MNEPDQLPDRDDGFVSPREMLGRVAFVGGLASLTAGLVLVPVGLLIARFDVALLGLASYGVAWGARHWLRAQSDIFVPRDHPFAFDLADVDTGDPQVQRLVALVQAWRKLEDKRGSPEFDPWAVQAVRHDVKAVLDESPALRRLFYT